MKIEVWSPTIRRKEMDAVLSAMVNDRVGPGEGARMLLQVAREYLEYDCALALRSPATALAFALQSLGLSDGDGVVISVLSPKYYRQVILDLRLQPVYCDTAKGSACISAETVAAALSASSPAPAEPAELETASPAEPASPVEPGTASEEAAPGNTEAETPAAESGAAESTAAEPAPGGSAEEPASGGAEIPELSSSAVKCRCVILNHALGFSPDMDAFGALEIPVIEDISQSYGSSLNGKRTGSFGTFTILGLEEQDMLTAGGGALLYAQNRREAAVLRNLSPLAEYSLPDLNAAMALVQFRETERNLERRREIARAYSQAALRTRHRQFPLAENSEYNNYAFPLVLETGMKDVMAYAKKKEIAVESAFGNTLVGELDGAGKRYPEAWRLSLRTALFPLYPRLSSTETEKVAKLIMTLP